MSNHFHIKKPYDFVERIKITNNTISSFIERVYIVSQMKDLDGRLAVKTENYIEINHQYGKRLTIRFQGCTNITKAQKYK